MGWLIGSTLASMVAAFVVMRLYDYIAGGVAGGVSSTARAAFFIVTWTAITARAGMSAFSSRVRSLRRGNAAVRNRLDAITKGERL